MTIFKAAFVERGAISSETLKLRVKTEDLGANNTGGARIFDNAGHALDVELTHSHKNGGDDVFTGAVPLKRLHDLGFNLARLETTGFVETPGRCAFGKRGITKSSKLSRIRRSTWASPTCAQKASRMPSSSAAPCRRRWSGRAAQ